MNTNQYLIDATFYDKVNHLQFRRVYKAKGGFTKTVLNNKYLLICAVEFPSCFLIKPETFREWREKHGKKN